MSEPLQWVNMKCLHCEWRGAWNHHHVEQALARHGMLRRAPETDAELIWALFPSGLAQIQCPECGHAELAAAPQDDVAWPEARCCASCKSPIPPERLEAIPDTQTCVDCQTNAETSDSAELQEYCPKCGAPLALRLSSGAGLARYRLRCTGSPPCRL